MFLDDFAEYLVDVLADHGKTIILGDFNIHVNNKDDPDANVFSDMREALGLKSTHQLEYSQK